MAIATQRNRIATDVLRVLDKAERELIKIGRRAQKQEEWRNLTEEAAKGIANVNAWARTHVRLFS